MIINQSILGKIVGGTFTQNYTAPEGNYAIIASVDDEKQSIAFVNDIYVAPKGNDAWEGSSWDRPVQSISKAMNIVPTNGRIYLRWNSWSS